MAFNSVAFGLFLAVVATLHHGLVRDWTARKRVLLAASWCFYASWSVGFLGLLVGLTAATFLIGRPLARAAGAGARRRARALLALGVATNLGALATVKYGRFLWESAAAVGPLPPTPAFLPLLPPLAVSFYTLHAISFLVDTHRGTAERPRSFVDFALYIGFFPQLVAGPITRWGFFGPQLVRPRAVDADAVELGALLIVGGLVKKVVFADSLGGYVDFVHGNLHAVGGLETLVACYAYAFQIYFDFSGYTDIATGVAMLLGFRLPENFRYPYLALNPSEFWRRWHISLSTWLRDYLYIPLGGNRRGRGRTYVNLLLTMLLGGLWHGAAWTFVLWGAFHGAWLAVHRLLTAGGRAPRTPALVRRLVTFHLVVLGWILFRADSLATAIEVVERLGHRPLVYWSFPLGPVLLILIGVVTHGIATRIDVVRVWRRLPAPWQGAAYGLALALVGLLSARSASFIYFQF